MTTPLHAEAQADYAEMLETLAEVGFDVTDVSKIGIMLAAVLQKKKKKMTKYEDLENELREEEAALLAEMSAEEASLEALADAEAGDED